MSCSLTSVQLFNWLHLKRRGRHMLAETAQPNSSKPSSDNQQRGTPLPAVVIDTTELTLKHICSQHTRGIADKTILHAAFSDYSIISLVI